MSRLQITVKLIVILLLTSDYICGNCDLKSETNMKGVHDSSVETRNSLQDTVEDFPDARSTKYADTNTPFNDTNGETNKDSISSQSNLEDFYQNDRSSPNEKYVRMKRYISPDNNSNVTNTTKTMLPDLEMFDYSQSTDDLDFHFNGENNDSFVILSPDYDESNVMTNVPPIYIRTLEEAESLLLSDEAQLFLNSFANEIQRNVIEYHMLHCPHTPLCGFKFQNIYFDKANFDSACESCLPWCENCNATDLCCPDMLDFENTARKSNTKCIIMSLKTSGSIYETVAKCPAVFHSDAKDPCSGDGDYNTFSDILPVTDTTTNVTYRNRQCAICNQVTNDNLLVWQPQLICDKTDAIPPVLKTEKDFIQFANNSKSCDITYFMSDESVEPILCLQAVSACNVTGNWSVFDPFISMACLLYENIYTVESYGFETTLYRFVSL